MTKKANFVTGLPPRTADPDNLLAASSFGSAQARAIRAQMPEAVREDARRTLDEVSPPAHYRTIVALDIERSTTRPNPVKGELRNKAYELFGIALHTAGIHRRHRDGFIDRGDGFLTLIHPVDQAAKAILLNRAIPLLCGLLAEYNARLPRHSQPQQQLRIRVVVHAGEIHYDDNGCYGEALDVAFRLLDAPRVKKALPKTADPLVLVISEDIYSSVVRHDYDGVDCQAFHPLVRVKVAGRRYPGWIQSPESVIPY